MVEKASSGTTPLRHRVPSAGGVDTGVAVVGFLLCFLTGGGLMWGHTRAAESTAPKAEPSGAAAEAPWADADAQVPITSADPHWGSRTAPVTLVLFSDLQCPACARGHGIVPQLQKAYGPEQLRIVWKHLPLPMHPEAPAAAEAAEAVFALAGGDAFFHFVETAFGDQRALGRASYRGWAKKAGVRDLAAFDQRLDQRTHKKKVDEDARLAERLGLRSTPTFLVNGIPIEGALPFERFRAVVDAELAAARAKVAGGIAPDRVYATRTRENFKAPRAEEPVAEPTVYNVPVGNAPILGDRDAPLTVVLFSDFECPVCKRAQPVLEEVRKAYGPKVRLAWKHEPLPFHAHARAAATLAEEARAQRGDRGFWAAHDKLFASAPALGEADLDRVAKELGLDEARWKAALARGQHEATIGRDEDLADSIGASGTPTFFINGRKVGGLVPFARLKPLLDEELARAETLLAKGTPRERLYDTLVAGGQGPRELEKKTLVPPREAPFKGNPNAKVVLQVVSDFQCVFCKRSEDAVTEVMKRYGDRVKLVWRNYPLPMHPEAPLAAQAALEAHKQKGPKAFWEMHDRLFASQADLSRATLDRHARELGLDMDRWKAALDGGVHKAAVDADVRAVSEAGINGTPGFLVNGYYLSGQQPVAKLARVLDRALAEAK